MFRVISVSSDYFMYVFKSIHRPSFYLTLFTVRLQYTIKIACRSKTLHMTNRSKLLLEISVLLIIVSICFTFWRSMVTKDFVVVNDLESESGAEENMIEDLSF